MLFTLAVFVPTILNLLTKIFSFVAENLNLNTSLLLLPATINLVVGEELSLETDKTQFVVIV